MRKHPIVLLVLTVLGLSGSATCAEGLPDHLIVVTTSADAWDAFDGQCSLREAVYNLTVAKPFSPVVGECPARDELAHNVVALQNDEIYDLTRDGPAAEDGDLTVSLPTGLAATIRAAASNGPRATLRQQPGLGWRILHLSNGQLSLENVLLTGANVSNDGTVLVDVLASLRMRDVVMHGNAALSGGCILSRGTLEIVDSQFSQCSANSNFEALGGAIWSNGLLSIEDSQMFGNNAKNGGAIYLAGGTATMSATASGFTTVEVNAVSENGGGIFIAGDASLTVNGVHFLGNHAISDGGAIYHEGTQPLLVDGAQFVNNSADGSGGGICLVADAQVSVLRSNFAENTAMSVGGAIGAYSEGLASVSIFDSVLTGNTTTVAGGAIAANRIEIDGALLQGNSAVWGGGAIVGRRLQVSRSRFLDNEATGGAPLGVGGAVMIGTESVENSRFSQVLFNGNQAGGTGGALGILGGVVELANVTVSNNSAATGGGLYVGTAADVTATNATFALNLVGLDIAKFGILRLKNSIVATPEQPNCITSLDNPLIVSLGNNLADDLSCIGLGQGLGTLTDLLNMSAELAPLSDNGGLSDTHALLPGSPAINAGDSSACAGDPVSGIDQRGGVRPLIGCDIGAHEEEFSFVPIFSDGFENN